MQRTPQTQLHRRRVYVKMRIPLLREEIARTVDEVKVLADKLKNAAPEAEETKTARTRLIYLTEHRDILRKELQALQEEQQTLPKGAGPAAQPLSVTKAPASTSGR